jgi:hypothetical protein
MLWNCAQSVRTSSENVEVIRGDFALRTQCHGDVHAAKSVTAAVIRQPYKVLQDMYT